MGSNAQMRLVKLESAEGVVLPFSDAQKRENIAMSEVLRSPQKLVKPEPIDVKWDPDVVKKKEPDIAKIKPEAAEIRSIPRNYAMFKSPNEIQYTPEDFLKEGVKMVKNIKMHVKRLEVGNKLRKDVWLREIASLETQGSPSTMIAVCGATGAGKSSALNAILDSNIVPTSGMRACTAVITEISYHKEKTIEADVSFLSEKEWKDELEVLLEDLLDEDGQFRRTTDLRSEAGVAWHKVHALYPTLTQDRLAAIARRESGERVDAILKTDPKIMRLMGTTKKIVARNSKEFTKEIAKYIDSKDQKRGGKKDKDKRTDDNGPALWPLIRQVNVRCNSKALSTGAVLVDLPGVADANAARSNIARDYMKKADCVWILAPITRAVDDKTAKDLLGDAFKAQLMNGGFADVESTITFIATKCDDISCTEIIDSLALEDDPVLEEIEERLSEVRCQMKGWKQTRAEAEKSAKGITAELKVIRSDLAESQEHLRVLEEGKALVLSQPSKDHGKKRKNSRGGKGGSPKRKREDFDDDEDLEMTLDPDADEDDDSLDDFIVDDGSITIANSDDEGDRSDSDREDDSDKADSDSSNDESVVSVHDGAEGSLSINDVKAVIEQKKADLKNARERLSEARKQRKEAMDVISNLTKKQNEAQKDKNAFCSLKRSEFSRDVLKEDFRSGLKELDDAAEEKRNPMGFDPSVNLRDYSNINLPVFTISSRDYIRIKQQVKGDGGPSCFTNVDDTGIPELQRWCHTLTIKSRERAARNFRNQLRVFAVSVKSYLDSFGRVSETDKEVLRQKWESTPGLGLYTIDSDDDNQSDEDEDDGYDWVYERGRLIPVARARARTPRFGTSTNSGQAKRDGITGRLAEEFRHVIASSVEGMQRAFKDGLEEKCQEGANAAEEAALEISDAFAASMHWATYRATLRRDGVWRRNLNEELISPMTKNIASSWAKTFENNLFSEFEAKSSEVISELLQEVEESCPTGLRDRAHHQGQLCLEEVKVALRKTIDVVSEELTSGQKEVSRCLEPHVREQLSDGYSRAMEERGRGSVARQKLVFRNFVATNKGDLFEDGADVIFERLDKVAISVGKALEEAMYNTAEKVEVNLAVLWEAGGDIAYLTRERADAVEGIDAIWGQLSLWGTADKARNLLTAEN